MSDIIERLRERNKSPNAYAPHPDFVLRNEAADTIEALRKQVAELTAERDAETNAANLYAKQVAHWIEKHDALRVQGLIWKDERDALQAKLNPTVLRCMHCDYATELQHVCEQCGERWAA